MACVYNVTISGLEQENLYRVTWFNHDTGEEDSFETSAVGILPEEITTLWHHPEHRLKTGHKLFRFLDGKDGHLQKALACARELTRPLTLRVYADKKTAAWPFELLAAESYLLIQDMHLVRGVSAGGKKEPVPPQKQPLKLLFMACSPLENPADQSGDQPGDQPSDQPGLQPAESKDQQKALLDGGSQLLFEKEEEAMFQATAEQVVDMEIENTGSLEGLCHQLQLEAFDIVHLSGQAALDTDGRAYFLMEDETGAAKPVYPSSLWDNALMENPPRLVFLSGSGSGETPALEAAGSFARELIGTYGVEAVLSWGRDISDEQASLAARIIYNEMSRGKGLLAAVQRARYELFLIYKAAARWAWPLLRLYIGETPLTPLVEKQQTGTIKLRNYKHIYLEGSEVKVLEQGFIGRRRLLQQGLRALKPGGGKTGVILYGPGGLGKSCLAGKIRQCLPQHYLVIVRGRLNSITLRAALKKSFIDAREQTGRQLLDSAKDMKEILVELCAAVFKEKNYVLVLDDFHRNRVETGTEESVAPVAPVAPVRLLPEASELLKALLENLSPDDSMTRLIITGRDLFTLFTLPQKEQKESDLAEEKMERIRLIPFSKAEQLQKLRQLQQILTYPDKTAIERLLAAGRGNPLLMEWLDKYTGEKGEIGVPVLLISIKDKSDDVARVQVARELSACGGKDMTRFLSRLSLYRRPVFLEGVQEIAEQIDVAGWEELLRRGIYWGLVEEDQERWVYEVMPLLKEEFAASVEDKEAVHRTAYTYYTRLCETQEDFDPLLSEEWIHHALACGEEEVAIDQGGRLARYLVEHHAPRESLRLGEWVLAEKRFKSATHDTGLLLNALAYTLHVLGDNRKAINYVEQALETWKNVYGERHPTVATSLNNLGEAWRALGEPLKAIEYYEQALAIDKAIYGLGHHNVALRLNNLGEAWKALGDPMKAFDYYEKALSIDEAVLGPEHPHVARDLNNVGLALYALDEPGKAVEYVEKSLTIRKKIYGEHHPQVAAALNNLGATVFNLGEKQQAKVYFSQAYEIWKKSLGEEHPDTITAKKWLDKCL